MIDHLGIDCTDLPRAAAFYDRVLGVLGQRGVMDVGEGNNIEAVCHTAD